MIKYKNKEILAAGSKIQYKDIHEKVKSIDDENNNYNNNIENKFDNPKDKENKAIKVSPLLKIMTMIKCLLQINHKELAQLKQEEYYLKRNLKK